MQIQLFPWIPFPCHYYIIECFRGQHRGGRNFTSFLRFSGPFFHATQRALSTLELAPPWREPPWSTAWLQIQTPGLETNLFCNNLGYNDICLQLRTGMGQWVMFGVMRGWQGDSAVQPHSTGRGWPGEKETHTHTHTHQARKKEHKPKLFGPDIFRWGRVLPCEGGGQKFGMYIYIYKQTRANVNEHKHTLRLLLFWRFLTSPFAIPLELQVPILPVD